MKLSFVLKLFSAGTEIAILAKFPIFTFVFRSSNNRRTTRPAIWRLTLLGMRNPSHVRELRWRPLNSLISQKKKRRYLSYGSAWTPFRTASNNPRTGRGTRFTMVLHSPLDYLIMDTYWLEQ